MYDLPTDPEDSRVCPRCGVTSPAASEFCQGCGTLLEPTRISQPTSAPEPPTLGTLWSWWWLVPLPLAHLVTFTGVTVLIVWSLLLLIQAFCTPQRPIGRLDGLAPGLCGTDAQVGARKI